MNRFLLFAGETYYPSPGFENFVDSFKTRYEAFSEGSKLDDGWFQIVDMYERNYETFFFNHGSPTVNLARNF